MNRLKELRENKNISLNALSIELEKKYNIKIGKASLSNYERDLQSPKKDTWEKLADYFEVSVPYIMGVSELKHDSAREADEFLNSLSILKILTETDSGKILGRINDKLENISDKSITEKIANSFTEYLFCLDSILESDENYNKLESFSEASSTLTDIFTDIIIWQHWEETTPNKEYLETSLYRDKIPKKIMLPTNKSASVNEVLEHYFQKNNSLNTTLNSYLTNEIKRRF